MLRSETAIQDPAPDPLGAEKPAYQGAEFDEPVAQVSGDGAEKLDLVGFEDKGLVAGFLFFFFSLFAGDGVHFMEGLGHFAFSLGGDDGVGRVGLGSG
jgi:hypothetical protein